MPRYQHVEGSTTTGSTTQGFTTRGSTTLAPEHLDELISEVQYTCRRGIDERLGIFGMSEAQRQALRVIHGHPGLSQRQLARLMDQSEQASSTLLARLLVRGLRFLPLPESPW